MSATSAFRSTGAKFGAGEAERLLRRTGFGPRPDEARGMEAQLVVKKKQR